MANFFYSAVGNIKRTHLENGTLRYGTRAFTGNTKVYLCGKLWNKDKKTIEVLGLNRGNRYYVDSVPVELIENVRVKRVYKERILQIMGDFEFFDCWWGDSREDKKSVTQFVEWWNSTLKEKKQG